MASNLATHIRNNGGARNYFQFRLKVTVAGLDFVSPVYTYEDMLNALDEHGLDWEELRRIEARPAGQLEWETF